MEKGLQTAREELDRANADLDQSETERKAAETQLRALQRQLEAKEEELDASLEQVMHLVSEAERANRAQDQFLDNMSHELLTPLTGIVGCVSLLNACGLNLDEEQGEYLALIEKSSEDLQTVIQGILDLANAKRGSLKLASVDFDLRVLLKETFEGLRREARDKDLVLISDIGSNVPARVCGDPNALRRILVHLARNAIFFTRSGTVDVRIEVVEETASKVEVALVVEDTGPGMSEEQTGLLFNLFEREEIAATSLAGGSGLGLLVANTLSMKMSSKPIHVESKLGVGSRFRFFVVLTKQTEGAETDDQTAEDLQDSEPSPVAVEDQRILVVGPENEGRATICKCLDDWQTDYRALQNGADALACLREAAGKGSPFHQVIIDPLLIGSSVESFCGAIDIDLALAGTQLIICASKGEAGDGERYSNLGVAAYLTQPVKPFRLYNCLQSVAAKPAKARRQRPSQLVTRHTLAEDRRHGVCPLLISGALVEKWAIAELIKRWGYSLAQVPSPDAAIEALKSESADYTIVIAELDVAIAAAKHIRASHSDCKNPHLPIIGIAEDADSEMRGAGREAAVTDIIVGPDTADKLLKLIEIYALGAVPAAEPIEKEAPGGEESMDVFHWQQMRDYLLATMEGDEDLTTMILDLFFNEDIPDVQTKLLAAIAAGDAEAIHREGHTLKGAAANVGAESLREIALGIENAGRAHDVAKAKSLSIEFTKEFSRLSEEKAAATSA
jgi:signal transduction histidine kinase/CheY-like chemotaxis protein